jgi:restriction endonuclease S subunit
MSGEKLSTPEAKLGDIEDWHFIVLKSLVRLRNGSSFNASDWKTTGIPIIRIQNLKDKGASFNYFKGDIKKTVPIERGDLLFSWSGSKGTSFGPHIWDGPLGVLNQHIFKVTIIDQSVVEKRFLFYMLKHLTAMIEQSAYGVAALVHVRKGDLEATIIPLPVIDEQRKLSFILSIIQEAKEKTENVINALKELKKSMMKHFFTYGPVSVEDAEKVPLKETEIGMIPEHWEVGMLGNYCNFTTGKLNSNQAVAGGLYPFFTCSQETYRIDKYSFECEAVLLAGNNARGIYSVKHYKGKFDAYQRTYVITIKDVGQLGYIFLKNVLETKLDELRVSSIGTSTKFLTLKMLLSLSIPLPPFPEQQQIAQTLSAIDNKIEAEGIKKDSLETLFKTLLSLLMTGKIRVKDLEIPV